MPRAADSSIGGQRSSLLREQNVAAPLDNLARERKFFFLSSFNAGFFKRGDSEPVSEKGGGNQ